jgi:hypothetical protein
MKYDGGLGPSREPAGALYARTSGYLQGRRMSNSTDIDWNNIKSQLSRLNSEEILET